MWHWICGVIPFFVEHHHFHDCLPHHQLHAIANKQEQMQSQPQLIVWINRGRNKHTKNIVHNDDDDRMSLFPGMLKKYDNSN